MGHDVPTMVGVDQKGVAERIAKLVPDYMAMGENGMHEMAGMEMPIPDNTLPMMTGRGPFGPVAMGGMFSVVKVRDDVRAGDYNDPGPYRHPPGTVAYEFNGQLQEPKRAQAASTGQPSHSVRRPSGHAGH
jgi:manganese oxidase